MENSKQQDILAPKFFLFADKKREYTKYPTFDISIILKPRRTFSENSKQPSLTDGETHIELLLRFD